MIRLEGLSNEFFEKLLSGIISQETTQDTYKYWRFLSELLPADETITYINLIWEALDILREIQVLSKDVPTLDKDSILSVTDSIIYSEIKEARHKGYAQFMRYNLGEELDITSEASIVELGRNIRSEVISILDNAIALNLTIEESYAVIPEFIDHYGQVFTEEIANLINTFRNNDSSYVRENFWGWQSFLLKYKIKTIKDLPNFLNLSSKHYKTKVTLNSSISRPLTSLEQIEEMEKEHLETGTPLFDLGFDILNSITPPKAHEVTLCVGERGLGKTKVGSFITANAMNQNIRVMFYSPEIKKSKLFFNFVFPAYVRATCNFLVTPDQILRKVPHLTEIYSPEERQNLVNYAKIKFVEEGNFMHIDTPYNYSTLGEEFRADIIKFQPDIIIWDHTQDIRGNVGMNEMTMKLAETFEDIKREFPIHIFALSHTGSEFKKPSVEEPIITSKIASWSSKLEIVADNIIGMFGSEGQRINFFFTKLRWHPPVPMWKTFRMSAEHNWFYYQEEDNDNGGPLNDPLLESLQQGYDDVGLIELLNMDSNLNDDLFGLGEDDKFEI